MLTLGRAAYNEPRQMRSLARKQGIADTGNPQFGAIASAQWKTGFLPLHANITPSGELRGKT